MNYGHIANALDYYQSRGYAYIRDAPWYVSHDAYNATKPEGSTDIRIATPAGMFGNLVASGEQSFIQMILDGQPLKRAICATPCFRWESRPDEYHRQYFMKAELINGQDVDVGHLMHMIHEACSFFEQFIPQVRVIQAGPGYDIVEKDSRMELGSYGIRTLDVAGRSLKWIYGTACAEPRLSTVIERFRRREYQGMWK